MAKKVVSVEEIRARLQRKGMIAPDPAKAAAVTKSEQSIEPTVVVPRKLTPAQRRAKIDEVLAEYGIDPVRELLEMYNETDQNGDYVMSPKERKALMQELLQYMTPKLKAVDMRAAVKGDINVNIVSFKDMAG